MLCGKIGPAQETPAQNYSLGGAGGPGPSFALPPEALSSVVQKPIAAGRFAAACLADADEDGPAAPPSPAAAPPLLARGNLAVPVDDRCELAAELAILPRDPMLERAPRLDNPLTEPALLRSEMRGRDGRDEGDSRRCTLIGVVKSAFQSDVIEKGISGAGGGGGGGASGAGGGGEGGGGGGVGGGSCAGFAGRLFREAVGGGVASAGAVRSIEASALSSDCTCCSWPPEPLLDAEGHVLGGSEKLVGGVTPRAEAARAAGGGGTRRLTSLCTSAPGDSTPNIMLRLPRVGEPSRELSPPRSAALRSPQPPPTVDDSSLGVTDDGLLGLSENDGRLLLSRRTTPSAGPNGRVRSGATRLPGPGQPSAEASLPPAKGPLLPSRRSAASAAKTSLSLRCASPSAAEPWKVRAGCVRCM